MTVRCNSEDFIETEPRAVAIAVRTVLAYRPTYRDTTEVETATLFRTNVKPSWWLLGTDMTIQLQPSSSGTQVITKTKSQWFILGDVFNYYPSYIQDFLRDLRNELQKQKS